MKETLQMAQGAGRLKHVNGVLVFKGAGGGLGSGEDLVGKSRNERIDELARSFEEKRPSARGGGQMRR